MTVSDDLGGEDAGCGGPGLIVEKLTSSSRTTALVDIPAVSMPIARSP